MNAHYQSGSPSFRLVAKGLVALHKLIKDGNDDSPEAESIRDALDSPLKALSPSERERARWLSEDLYSVSEPPITSTLKNMNPQAQQQLNEAIEARQNREWDRALALLRRWKEYISPALLSYIRGSIWLEAGSPDIAAVFFGHASQNEPNHARYQALYLDTLAKSDPGAAGELAKEVLAHEEDCDPIVVAHAANIRFNETVTGSDAESAGSYQQLIPVLERTITRIEQDMSFSDHASAFSMAVALIGTCYEFLGNAGTAVTYYTRGLEVSPDNDALLVARGILLYGTSPRAITDFERAVKLGSPLVWPYLFLAHHYQLTGQFENCRVISEAGLKRNGSDTAKSQLEEWRAIAQAELGFPLELVRSAFEAAIRFDPSNELAKRNRHAYEESFKIPHAASQPRWEQKSEAAVRQLGLAERRYSLAA